MVYINLNIDILFFGTPCIVKVSDTAHNKQLPKWKMQVNVC